MHDPIPLCAKTFGDKFFFSIFGMNKNDIHVAVDSIPNGRPGSLGEHLYLNAGILCEFREQNIQKPGVLRNRPSSSTKQPVWWAVFLRGMLSLLPTLFGVPATATGMHTTAIYTTKKNPNVRKSVGIICFVKRFRCAKRCTLRENRTWRQKQKLQHRYRNNCELSKKRYWIMRLFLLLGACFLRE